MNYKVIFNALIIVLIIHLLLVNIDYKEVLNFSGRALTKEHMTNSDDNIYSDDRMDGLYDDDDHVTEKFDNNADLKNQLLDYAKSFELDDNKDGEPSNSKVLPGNFFESNENVPNFESNVANLPAFYKNNYDSLSKEDLANLDTSNQLVKTTTCIQSNGERPQTWSYDNELPMNGGSMGGIVGFNDLEGQYGVYDNSSLNSADCRSDNAMNLGLESNDLRKPNVVN